MLADTDVIRTLGSASSANAADLAALASTLSSLPYSASADIFGPVGARFLAALADATRAQAQAVAALSDSVSASCATANASATGYDDAEQRASGLIAGL